MSLIRPLHSIRTVDLDASLHPLSPYNLCTIATEAPAILYYSVTSTPRAFRRGGQQSLPWHTYLSFRESRTSLPLFTPYEIQLPSKTLSVIH